MQKVKRSATKFLSTEETPIDNREAAINVGRKHKRDHITSGEFKNDRLSPRQKINKEVKLGMSKAKFWSKGVIKDISKTGARISVESGLFISRNIIIYDEERGDLIPAYVVRNTLDSIGIRFTASKSKVFPSSSKFFAEVHLDTARKLVHKELEKVRKVKEARQRKEMNRQKALARLNAKRSIRATRVLNQRPS